MEKFISGFNKGVDRDTNVNKYGNQTYYDAQNLRLISKDTLSNGALTNVNGSVEKLNLTSGDSIVGHCVIRDSVILFVANDAGGKIYKFTDDNNDTAVSPTLIYTDPELVFPSDGLVRAVGYYETPDIQKVYFTDGATFFKHLNVASNTLITDVPISATDLITDIEFKDITLEVLATGNLKAGKIQYAYQVYNIHGSESSISPTSQLAHLTSSAETAASTYKYKGSEVNEIVNKSVKVSLTVDVDSSRVKIYALEYSVYQQVPNVRVVGIYDTKNITQFSVVDSGQSIGNVTLEEFRQIQQLFYPKTIERKNNKLFAGNITEQYFDIDDSLFDARAFRFNSSGVSKVFNGSSEYTIPSNFDNIPLTDEVFNPFNDWSTNDYSTNTGKDTSTFYKFKSDGVTLGGSGKYINYSFVTNSVLLDDTILDSSGYANNYTVDGDETIIYFPKQEVFCQDFSNYSNPLLEAGYKRDEVYRFGIVFRDLKGRPSYVKWIGDIRMPSNKEYPFVTYNSATQKTYANVLGLKFDITLPDALKALISGYQIVRAERTNDDKTILSQGVLGYLKDSTNDLLQLRSLGTMPFVADCIYGSVKNQLKNTTGIPASPYTKVGATLNKNYMEFISPEVVFNKPEYTTNNAYIEAEGYVTSATTVATMGQTTNDPSVIVANKYWEYGSPDNFYRQPINNFKVFTPKLRGNTSGDYTLDATLNYLEGNVLFNNFCDTTKCAEGYHFRGARGTFGLISTSDGFGISTGDYSWLGSNSNRVILANYKVARGRSIYGGSKYEERSNTKYYPVGKFISKDSVASEETPPTTVPEPNIQIISSSTGFIVQESFNASITTSKALDLIISNYGDDSLVLSSMSLSDSGFNWIFTENFSGSTIPAGGSVLTSIHYIGPETGTSTASVIFTSNAANDTQFEFLVTVDFNTNPPDSYSSSISPADNIVPQENNFTTDALAVFGGDTYINFMWYLRSMWDVNWKTLGQDDPGKSDRSIENVLMFPVESTINLNLRLDEPQKFMHWGFARSDRYFPNYKLLETVQLGVASFGTKYPTQVGDLYRYNTAYSCIDKSFEFFSKPFDAESTKYYDTRILASNLKTPGEYTDNWLKFGYNESIDLDSEYGPIVRLYNFNNVLYSFQEEAVAAVAINDRSLIQDNNAGALTLGTGGVLTRYDYITTAAGTNHYSSIISSDLALYYVSDTRKRIYKLTNNAEPLSLIKGLDSELDTYTYTTVTSGFDHGYNEVLFTIDGNTWVFNEFVDAFIGRYTVNARGYLSIGKNFFSYSENTDEVPWLVNNLENVLWSDDEDDYMLIADSGTSDKLYKHNVGFKGTFPSGGVLTASDSYITMILNPNGNMINSYDTLDLRTSVTTEAGVDVTDETFYQVDFENDYQSYSRTLEFISNINENTGTIKRIGRVWRVPLVPVLSTGTKRMIDTYVKVKLNYDNTTDNHLKLFDVVTYYRPSKH